MGKIVLLADFPLSRNMAGPLMRYYELSAALSAQHEVTLAGERVESDFIPPASVKVLKTPAFKSINFIFKATLPNPDFLKEINKFEIIITHGRILRALGLSKIKTKLIIDLYGPWFIEDLVSGKNIDHRQNMKGIKELLLRGDYFICANERQKDLYIGMLLMAGRADSDLDDKIGLVPMGISPIPPLSLKPRLKGVIPGINPGDKIIISWGGMWDWLDHQTLIEMMSIISQKRKDLKLVFFGSASPEKGLSRTAKESLKMAKNYGLFEKQVFFIDHWIPYSERGEWLLEGDLAVISHYQNLETRFAWRTRALDLLWAGLPIVSSEGDPLSEIIKGENLGRVVPCGDPPAFAHKILELIENPHECQKIKQSIQDFIPNLYWGNLIGPIHEFIK